MKNLKYNLLFRLYTHIEGFGWDNQTFGYFQVDKMLGGANQFFCQPNQSRQVDQINVLQTEILLYS